MAIYKNPGWWGVLRKTTLDGGAKVNSGRGGGFQEKREGLVRPGGGMFFICNWITTMKGWERNQREYRLFLGYTW